MSFSKCMIKLLIIIKVNTLKTVLDSLDYSFLLWAGEQGASLLWNFAVYGIVFAYTEDPDLDTST